jgi:integrase
VTRRPRGFEAARDEAGLPDHLSFRDLRHAGIARLIASGLDPVTTAAIAGHENATITSGTYAHLFDRQAQDPKIRAALAS